MKRRRLIWLVLLTVALLVCLFSYRLPSRAVTRTRIVVARDVSDLVGPSQAKTGYEPYFNRVNVVVPDLAVAGVSNAANTGR
jgi:hypothetical protein